MDEEVMESGYDYAKFDEVLEKSKEYLLKLNSKKKLKIIRKLVKNPNFDETDVYRVCEYEFQKPTYKPPLFVEPKKPPPTQPEERHCAVEDKEPLKIRFVMSGREPIREQKKPVHKSEKMGSKRPRESESERDWDISDEEEKGGAKKRANKKKTKVHDVDIVAPENTSELPAEFKERIQNLGGSNVALVLKKKLFITDVNPNNTRLSLPWKQINMGFLSEEERNFLATREIGRGVPQIMSRIIGGNGSEHGISVRQWDMNTSKAYNLVTGWNDVVKHQSLCAGMTVELWSFRVEGSLWFALVKL